MLRHAAQLAASQGLQLALFRHAMAACQAPALARTRDRIACTDTAVAAASLTIFQNWSLETIKNGNSDCGNSESQWLAVTELPDYWLGRPIDPLMIGGH